MSFFRVEKVSVKGFFLPFFCYSMDNINGTATDGTNVLMAPGG